MSTAKIPGLDSASVPPVNQIPGHDHNGHTVQFYSQDSFLLDGLSRFIGTALGAGDAAVILATRAHREGLESRLHAHGLNTAGAVSQGRYIAQDAAETLAKIMVEGFPDAARFREVIGSLVIQAQNAVEHGRRVAAFGEALVALLWEDGNTTRPFAWSNCGMNWAKSIPSGCTARIPSGALRRKIMLRCFSKSVRNIPK